MMGMPQKPLPPKRKAYKSMIRKLFFFGVTILAVRVAPYILTFFVSFIRAV